MCGSWLVSVALQMGMVYPELAFLAILICFGRSWRLTFRDFLCISSTLVTQGLQKRRHHQCPAVQPFAGQPHNPPWDKVNTALSVEALTEVEDRDGHRGLTPAQSYSWLSMLGSELTWWCFHRVSLGETGGVCYDVMQRIS